MSTVPKKKTLSIQTGPTFYDETTEDEVDESQMSYRGSLIKRRKHQRKRLTIQLLKIQNKTQVMYLI
jgi:hypothetical protein